MASVELIHFLRKKFWLRFLWSGRIQIAMLLKLGKGILRVSSGRSVGCGRLGEQEEETGGFAGAHLVVSGKQGAAP